MPVGVACNDAATGVLVEGKRPIHPQGVTRGSQTYDSIDYEAPAIQTYGSTAVVATKVVMTGSIKG